MIRKTWIFFFILILLIHLVTILVESENTQFATKPLLVPLLVGYFFTATGPGVSMAKWIGLGLAFSWLGDILLLFAENDELFFLLGLSSFLIAHISYIVLFHKIRVLEKIRGNVWLIFVVVIYYVSLVAFLSPYLGNMRIPVRIYGLVISFMFLLALHMLFLKDRKTGILIAAGAVLFVLSDSVLAINKFYRPLPSAGFVIMLTYGMAQFFIVDGAARYIRASLGKKRVML
jgi:uncharacterized membrane protein YhhN